jgi:hypothetical protein
MREHRDDIAETVYRLRGLLRPEPYGRHVRLDPES